VERAAVASDAEAQPVLTPIFDLYAD